MTKASEVDERIAELGDWRGETLSRLRRLIKEADPDVVEDVKWRKASNPGVPVWSHDGIICTGESYKSVVKLTFARGASLTDPDKLFNSSLEGNVRRAIDIREGEEIDARAFKELIRAAVAVNTSRRKRRGRSCGSKTPGPPCPPRSCRAATSNRPSASSARRSSTRRRTSSTRLPTSGTLRKTKPTMNSSVTASPRANRSCEPA